MKATRIALLTALLILAAGLAHAADTIKIGAIFSATGPASFLGEPEKNTVEMVQDQINESGGLLD